MHRLEVLFLTATLLAVASPGRGADSEVDGLLARMGSEYFQQYCASCHGLSGRGDGPVAPALASPPADLTRIAQRRGGAFPDGEIARFIDGRFEVAAHGSREMPIWGRRFGDAIPESAVAEEIVRGRILTLVEYLKSIQRTE
jgi:mono/diheme cytochrome c family protein